MPLYRLALDANDTTLNPHGGGCTYTARSFRLFVTAPNAAAARASIGNNPVTDPRDGQLFAEWRIMATRKVAKAPPLFPYEHGLKAGRDYAARAADTGAAIMNPPNPYADSEHGPDVTAAWQKAAWQKGWTRGAGSTPAGRRNAFHLTEVSRVDSDLAGNDPPAQVPR